MRKLFGQLHIGLSRTSLAVVETQGWLRPRMHQIADIPLPTEGTALPAQLSQALESALAEEQCIIRAGTVVLADDLVRLFIVNPPKNAARMQDCLSAVHMRFQALYGETSADWSIDADHHATMPFLACAIPKNLLDAIHIAAAKQRLTLVEVVPQFIALWNTWCHQLEESAWLGVVHQNTLTLGAIQGQRIAMVRSAPLPTAFRSNEAWLADHVSKEAMRWNLPATQHMYLYGDFPAHWVSTTASRLKCSPLSLTDMGTHEVALSSGMMLAYTGLRR